MLNQHFELILVASCPDALGPDYRNMKKEKLKTDMLIARIYDCDFQSDLVNCLEWIYTSTGTTNKK